MYAISTSALTKDYGNNRGIFDLNLEVGVGEAFGFIGPNGAGKTTTLRLFMDLIRPDRGRAQIMGLDTQRDGVKLRRLVGFLPGEPPDYPNQTGQQILDLLAHLRGEVDPTRVTELAQLFDLDLHRKYREYSHGNKQKVWLIQAFMHNPKLLLLDEPTNGLDPLMQQAFRRLLAESRERGATVFLSSHLLPEVQETCDRIGVIYQGALRRVGSLADLRTGNIHRIDVRTENEMDRARLAALAGVTDIAISEHRVQCTLTGTMQPLLDALQTARVLSIDSSELTLEEVFLAQYGQPA
ncbi:MAG TPA: ABC transporter ATP-binding protein [Candidatus Nitrosotalea sp.]|nr:ABC transporter ATP-binding protein [Candidatus Nitrosotalea sp.]